MELEFSTMAGFGIQFEFPLSGVLTDGYRRISGSQRMARRREMFALALGIGIMALLG